MVAGTRLLAWLRVISQTAFWGDVTIHFKNGEPVKIVVQQHFLPDTLPNGKGGTG